MALQQPASSNFWSESQDAGAGVVIEAYHLVSDGAGGMTDEAVSVGNATAARILSDGAGGFVEHAGDANPSSLAELHLISDGYGVTDYQ